MNSQQLQVRLEEAKKRGYYEVRYSEYKVDFNYWFGQELAKGYEILKVEYPANDKGQDIAFPRATFKFNDALEKDFKRKIAIQKLHEEYSIKLQELRPDPFHVFQSDEEFEKRNKK